MRVCPKCGYIDPPEWRPRSWHTHSEIEICRLGDLKEIAIELFNKLVKTKETVTDKYYAYKISKTGLWVYRRPMFVYKYQGWKDIPAEWSKDNRQVTKNSLHSTRKEGK